VGYYIAALVTDSFTPSPWNMTSLTPRHRRYAVEDCDPIKGVVSDYVVSWKGDSDLSRLASGAVSLIFLIPNDATAFAFSL
jgi:hypothetical protein